MVVVKVAIESSSFTPNVSVWNAQREQIADCVTLAAAAPGCKLPADGAYTIQVEFASSYRDPPYNYSLFLERPNNLGNVQPITFGQTLTGTLQPRAEVDSYTFEAKANDVVVVKVAIESSSFTPNVSECVERPERADCRLCHTRGGCSRL